MTRLALALLLTAACAPGVAQPEGPAPADPANGAAAQPEAGAAVAEREGRGDAVELQPDPHAIITIRRVDTVSMQLPTGSQVQVFERAAYLTAVAEQGGDAHRMTFTLDSVVAAPGGFLPPDSLTAARGTRWTARLLPDGRLVDLAMDTVRGAGRTGVGDQTTRMLDVLYPTLPPDGVRAGAAWSDSVATTTETGGFSITETGVIQYTASSGDAGGFVVVGEGVLDQDGSGMQFGQELAMSGQGRRTITYRLDRNGRLAGASGTDSAELEIIVPAVGQTVPMSQSSRFDVTIAAR